VGLAITQYESTILAVENADLALPASNTLSQPPRRMTGDASLSIVYAVPVNNVLSQHATYSVLRNSLHSCSSIITIFASRRKSGDSMPLK
jgi:hypothetical protein